MDPQKKALDQEILRFIKEHSLTANNSTEKIFNTLALNIFSYQYKYNNPYRKYCNFELKNPTNLKSWKDIPAMPSEGFKELTLSTFPPKKAAKVFKTSGTTRDVRGAHLFDTLKLYEAALLPVFKEYLIPDSAKLRFFFLMASPEEAPFSSLSYMMGVVNKAFSQPKGIFYVQKGDFLKEKLLKDLLAVKKEKIMVLCTAFSLKAFLDFLKEEKIKISLPKGSRLMETGGFKGMVKEVSKASLYAECEKVLGIPKEFCVSEYGMTELSSQCYDTTLKDKLAGIKRKHFKLGPAWMRTLVIDPRTGREAKKGSLGVLRHFDLANRGSVLAVQTEDIGKVVGEGFEVIGRASQAELRGCSLTYEEFLRH